jgi:hypothetical protein
MSYPTCKINISKKGDNMRKSIMVSRMDKTKATKIIQAMSGSDIIEAENMVVVNTRKGLATICTEGVGWFKNDEDKYLVGAWIDYSNPSFYFTEEQLLSCLSDEKVDLKDFINTFGDRLENNFSIWYSYISEKSQELVK